jgi:isochorismate hydrolase
LSRTDISEEIVASIFKVEKYASEKSVRRFATLKMEETRSSERSVLQDPHGATFQKTSFFLVTAVKTSNPDTTHVISSDAKNLAP